MPFLSRWPEGRRRLFFVLYGVWMLFWGMHGLDAFELPDRNSSFSSHSEDYVDPVFAGAETDSALTHIANRLATNAKARVGALQAQLDAQVARGAIPQRMRDFLMREAGGSADDQIRNIDAALQRARAAKLGAPHGEEDGALADIAASVQAVGEAAATPFPVWATICWAIGLAPGIVVWVIEGVRKEADAFSE